MARVQLGKTLSEDDTTAITTFLKCLTGKVPDDFAKVPVLPPAAFPDVPPTGQRKPK
jgi:cytochrome c peroxidase